jgi:hypothetical protein
VADQAVAAVAQKSKKAHMQYSVTSIVAGAAVATVLAGVAVFSNADEQVDLTVHEWGTFTSIADGDGHAAEWRPLAGPPQLPCFVESNAFVGKGSLAGTVRMETPVLYFYAQQPAMVDVGVRFLGGAITEWFPHAAVSASNAPIGPGSQAVIRWRNVRIAPTPGDAFPVDPSGSHYYAARDTHAAPVAVGTQTEKFLFYRGVARFELPIAATIDAGGNVALRNRAQNPIAEVVLFTNDHGRLRYDVRHQAGADVTIDPPVFDREPTVELHTMLVGQGLYADEATAMINTWRSSWFEHGTRIFYIVPRPIIDSTLPLTIRPQPADIARVFVARTELVTAPALDEVKRALLNGDAETLDAYGRFLDPIARRLAATSSPVERAAIESQLQRSAAAASSNPLVRCET